MAHRVIQAAPALINDRADDGSGLHIVAQIYVFITKLLSNLLFSSGTLNDLFLNIGELKAFLGHCIKAANHDFTKAGGVVRHGLAVNFTAAAHTGSVVGKRVHHAQDRVTICEVGSKFTSTCNHCLIAVHSSALNVRGFLENLIVIIAGAHVPCDGLELGLHADLRISQPHAVSHKALYSIEAHIRARNASNLLEQPTCGGGALVDRIIEALLLFLCTFILICHLVNFVIALGQHSVRRFQQLGVH